MKLPITAYAWAGQQSSTSVRHAMMLQPERLDFSLDILLQRSSDRGSQRTFATKTTCTKTSAEVFLLFGAVAKQEPAQHVRGLAGQAGRVTSKRKLHLLHTPEYFLWDVRLTFVSHPLMETDSQALVNLPFSLFLHANLESRISFSDLLFAQLGACHLIEKGQ